MIEENSNLIDESIDIIKKYSNSEELELLDNIDNNEKVNDELLNELVHENFVSYSIENNDERNTK